MESWWSYSRSRCSQQCSCRSSQEDLRWHAKLPQPPQKLQPLLCPLYQLRGVEWPSEVLTDVDAQVFEAAHPLYFKLPDVQWLMRSPLLPHVYYHLLRLVCVEGETVVTPWHQTGHLPPAGCFTLPVMHPITVVSSANFRMLLSSCNTVIGEQGAEDGAEDASL